jgi:quercetin dioxygenase-like cupin family protein
MIRTTLCAVTVGCMLSLFTTPVWTQALAGPEKARPVQGDPGISSMVVVDQAQFRVLRDYAEPGAVRRMHNHADAAYHVFVLVTGQLQLTVQGEPMVEVRPGEALSLTGGAMHTFKNTGEMTATIVEVFGKAGAIPADLDAVQALAQALAPAHPRR